MTAALEGVSGQQYAPAALYPPERTGTHFTGGWVDPRAGLDGRKISSPPGFDPRTVQPVVSRYNEWATRPTDFQDYSMQNISTIYTKIITKFNNESFLVIIYFCLILAILFIAVLL